jgi:hypothetical protein
MVQCHFIQTSPNRNIWEPDFSSRLPRYYLHSLLGKNKRFHVING